MKAPKHSCDKLKFIDTLDWRQIGEWASEIVYAVKKKQQNFINDYIKFKDFCLPANQRPTEKLFIFWLQESLSMVSKSSEF